MDPSKTTPSSLTEPPNTPSDASLEEEIILLTQPKSVKREAYPPTQEDWADELDAPLTAPVDAPFTAPEQEGDEDGVILLTRPSSRMPLPALPLIPKLPPDTDTTLPDQEGVLPPSAYAELNRVPSFQEEKLGRSTLPTPSQPSALETRTNRIPPPVAPTAPAEPPHAPAPSMPPESDVTPLPSPHALRAISLLHDDDDDDLGETSETELMINDLLDPNRQSLTPAPASRASSSPSLVSLSQLSSLLDEEGLGDPVATFPNSDFRPSYEYLDAPDDTQQHTRRRVAQHQHLQHILSEFTQHCARACCFVLKDGLLVGVAAMGKGKIQERIEEMVFPLDVSSILSQCTQEHESYQGPLPDTAMDHIVAACLGGELPQTIGAFPVLQNDQVVAVFYLDDGGEKNFSKARSVFEQILEQAAILDFRWAPPTLEDLLAPLLHESEPEQKD